MNEVPETIYALIAIAFIIGFISFIIAFIMIPFNVKAIRKAVEKIVDLLEKRNKNDMKFVNKREIKIEDKKNKNEVGR